MKVLAVRNNSLLWKAPIIFIIGTAIICLIGRLYAPLDMVVPEDMNIVGYCYLLGLTEPIRRVSRVVSAIWLISRGSIFYALSVLFHKNVIIEYDGCGIYIYRKFKPVKTIRFEEFWSQSTREDFDEVYVMRRRTIKWRDPENYYRITDFFFGFIKTGTLRIETPYEVLNVGGIKNVKEVEIELNKLIKAKKREYLAQMEEKNAVENRMEELAELSKHNPYT